MTVTYVQTQSNLSANSFGSRFVSCPANSVVVGGGCGHRDFNAAQFDIRVNYSGPNPANPRQQWRCLLENNGSAARALITYAICSSATNVVGP